MTIDQSAAPSELPAGWWTTEEIGRWMSGGPPWPNKLVMTLDVMSRAAHDLLRENKKLLISANAWADTCRKLEDEREKIMESEYEWRGRVVKAQTDLAAAQAALERCRHALDTVQTYAWRATGMGTSTEAPTLFFKMYEAQRAIDQALAAPAGREGGS